MTEEEYRNQIDSEVKGAELAVGKMLLYYISSLQASGVEDVRQYVTGKIASIIQLSEEQIDFIKADFNSDNKIHENLKDCIDLLKNMETTKKLDIDSIKIVRNVLELILKDYDNVVNSSDITT